MIVLSAAQHSVVQLSERRLVQRLQRGEPRAFQELWLSRRDSVWSVLRGVDPDESRAFSLLKAVYLGLPGSVASWEPDESLCCLLASHVFTVVCAERGLSAPEDVVVVAPRQTRVPRQDDVRELLEAFTAVDRLIYALDLFFGCDATTLSRLVGADEAALRHARASVAYGLVNAGEAP